MQVKVIVNSMGLGPILSAAPLQAARVVQYKIHDKFGKEFIQFAFTTSGAVATRGMFLVDALHSLGNEDAKDLAGHLVVALADARATELPPGAVGTVTV